MLKEAVSFSAVSAYIHQSTWYSMPEDSRLQDIYLLYGNLWLNIVFTEASCWTILVIAYDGICCSFFLLPGYCVTPSPARICLGTIHTFTGPNSDAAAPLFTSV
jgi:hypothetical protein